MDTSFESLNCVDRAERIEALLTSGSDTKDIQESFGLSRYDVSHLRRLHRLLTAETKKLVKRAGLSIGHAKALTRCPSSSQAEVARSTIQYRWSVRRLEEEIRSILENREAAPDADYYQQLSDAISEQIGHPVKIRPDSRNPQYGTIEITYLGLEAFEGIFSRMDVSLS